MVIRQLQPQEGRTQSDEIPESDEGEVEDHGNDSDDNDNNNDDDIINDDLDEHPARRLSVSSVGSHYSPPSTASEGDDPALPDQHSLQAAPETPRHKPVFPLSRPKPVPFSPHSTVPPTPTHTNYWSSPRKRSLSPAHGSASASPRPFKRHRTAAFNHGYLALLNEDILDAATRFTPHTPGDDPTTTAPPLPASQQGLTPWSEPEKALLFEALARLGPDDTAGIAARIKTKGAVEVTAYIDMLKQAAASAALTKKEGGTAVVPAEVPAAVELSQACCAALEEAADAVSVRQDGHEEGAERKRWGEAGWLISAGNWREVEGNPPEGMRDVLGLFRVAAWVGLSERVFMNSAVEEYNWARVEGERPAVRATALEDFYALAVGVTRRLVAATVFVAEARVKARRQLYPDARSRVWKQDVEAAALSLGLPANSDRFWAKCARRLRLDVYDEESGDVAEWDGEGEQGPMSYDEVEAALGLEPERDEGDTAPDEETESSSEEEIDQDMASAAESDNGSIELGAGTPYPPEYEEPLPEDDEAEKAAVTLEMNELLVHSTLEYPKSGKPRDTLRNRIRAERAHEAYADKLDARATYYEEKRVWAMLERQPPQELVKPDVPEEPPKFTKRSVDELVKGFSRTPGDWRSKLEVVPSRWEMEYALAEEEKEKAKGATGAESGDEI